MQAAEQEPSEPRDELQSLQGQGQCMRHGLQKANSTLPPTPTTTGEHSPLSFSAYVTSIFKHRHPKHHTLWQPIDILDGASCTVFIVLQKEVTLETPEDVYLPKRKARLLLNRTCVAWVSWWTPGTCTRMGGLRF